MAQPVFRHSGLGYRAGFGFWLGAVVSWFRARFRFWLGAAIIPGPGLTDSGPL